MKDWDLVGWWVGPLLDVLAGRATGQRVRVARRMDASERQLELFGMRES